MVVISPNTAFVTGFNQSPVIASRQGIIKFNGGEMNYFWCIFFFAGNFLRSCHPTSSYFFGLSFICFVLVEWQSQMLVLIEFYKAVAGNEPFSKVVICRIVSLALMLKGFSILGRERDCNHIGNIPCQFILSEALILPFCVLACGLKYMDFSTLVLN